MAPITKIFASRIVEEHGQDHAGIFTWEIDTDRFHADEAISRLFEIDQHEAEKGLPLLTYLNRIHPDDRPRAAKSIHDTILSGGACQQDYRVLQRRGPAIEVMAFGRCFKGRNGGTSLYAGIVHIAPAEQSPKSLIQSNCLAAYVTARQEGETAIAEHLARALAEIERTNSISLFVERHT